jgi:hypothetical protein
LLASNEASYLPVNQFEKLIYFWVYLEWIKCFTLANIRVKLLYNRFVIYRTLKKLYKKGADCDFVVNLF